MAQNIRRPLTDTYDPKQRIVGGIVLFLLMLLLYLILKLILGISSPLDSGEYILQQQMFDSRVTAENPSIPTPPRTEETTPPNRPTRPLPAGFVFLDIRGNPMQRETFQSPETMPEDHDRTTTLSGVHWVVQAGSFLAEERAQRLVQELENSGIKAEITKINKWFTVRLLPQQDRLKAEQQLRQLRQKNIRGLIKKIEPN